MLAPVISVIVEASKSDETERVQVKKIVHPNPWTLDHFLPRQIR